MSRRRSSTQELPANLITLRVIGAALVVACCLLLTAIGLFWATRSSGAPIGQTTAIMNMIPAETPTLLGETLGGSTGPTPAAPPSPPPGVIAIDAYVQITGTAGAGLRFREEPGLEAPVLLLGSEAEVFRVVDGPQEADGYVWWYLVGPYDETRRGWAVANYLEIVQNP
jgi:hypothetical protein